MSFIQKNYCSKLLSKMPNRKHRPPPKLDDFEPSNETPLFQALTRWYETNSQRFRC